MTIKRIAILEGILLFVVSFLFVYFIGTLVLDGYYNQPIGENYLELEKAINTGGLVIETLK